MAMMEHEDISNENLAGHLLVAALYERSNTWMAPDSIIPSSS